jgi:ribosomal protein L40E
MGNFFTDLFDFLREEKKDNVKIIDNKVYVKCLKCGEWVWIKEEKCPKCGTPLSEMYKKRCPKCGTLNPLNAEKCVKCGYDFALEEVNIEKALNEKEEVKYVCPVCGYEMDTFMTQCPVCGTRFI